MWGPCNKDFDPVGSILQYPRTHWEACVKDGIQMNAGLRHKPGHSHASCPENLLLATSGLWGYMGVIEGLFGLLWS